jgi:predicted LPLAT superfamily acyltransferase
MVSQGCEQFAPVPVPSKGPRAAEPVSAFDLGCMVDVEPAPDAGVTASGTGPRFVLVFPTYNNASTLPGVLALAHAAFPEFPVVVVDDGSTDGTHEHLKGFEKSIAPGCEACSGTPSGLSSFHIVRHAVNRGKGAALVSGLVEAARLGGTHAVTIDTDGQHPMDAVSLVVAAACRSPQSLVVGDRCFEQAQNVPFSSRFGRKFSNFWVWVETGVQLADSQSGLRCYPLAHVPYQRVRTRRFDFEVEILVRSLQLGVPVLSAPVPVVYPKPAERISHFHVWKDNARLTRLHTRLVTGRLCSALGRPFFFLNGVEPSSERSGASLIAFWIKLLGIRACYIILWLVVPYYFFTARNEIRAIRSFYERLPGECTRRVGPWGGLWLVYRNFLFFAATLIDRVALSTGRLETEFLEDIPESLASNSRTPVSLQKGFILVGAHLGDWTLCAHALARQRPFNLAVVTDTTRSRSFVQMLKRLGQETNRGNETSSFKEIDSSSRGMSVVLDIRQHLDSGGVVCFLGDRSGSGARTVSVDFMGSPAEFPLLPFQVAQVMGCPIFSFFCTKRALSPHAPHHLVIRELGHLDKTAAEVQMGFVRELERSAIETPWCWFNFFDFWEKRGSSS